jgi:hypothetical protein
VRPDGDPDRDDYGLPRIDVVVPDDARELDRDLIAYRREERQRRRRTWLRRLIRPFGRYGVVAPIMVAALLVAVISGTLITTFGPRPIPHTPVTPGSHGPSATQSATPRPGTIGGSLPMGQVEIDGKPARLTDLQGIIMIVPAGCQCEKAVQDLGRQAQQGNLKSYLVGSRPWTADTAGELAKLAGQPGSGVQIVKDEAGVLTSTFQASGLTVVLVHIDGIVGDIRRGVQSGQPISPDQLRSLSSPGAGAAQPHS